MTPYIVIWAVLALVVLGLAAWRQVVGYREDDSIHIDDQKLVQQQSTMANKVALIDRWGKTLTVLTILYGIGLAGMFLYRQWIESSKLPTF